MSGYCINRMMLLFGMWLSDTFGQSACLAKCTAHLVSCECFRLVAFRVQAEFANHLEL